MIRRSILPTAFLLLTLWAGCDGDDSSGTPETGATTMSGSTGEAETSASSSTGGEGSTSNPTPTTAASDASSSGAEGSSSSSSDDGGGTSGTSGSATTVTGNVTRSVDIAGNNDGVGDIYLGLLVECADGAESVADVVVAGADLSQPGALVPFAAGNVPDGTYHLTGFFDDNLNADPNDPRPDTNDLAAVENFGPGCTEVVIAGADVDSVVVTVNFVVPF